MIRPLFALLLFVGAATAAPLTPGQTAVAYYLLCREIPVNLAKFNAYRSAAAIEADRKLPPGTLAARAGVLGAIGAQGNLAQVQVLSENTRGDRSKVSVILRYYNNLPPRQLDLELSKEDGVWKVAN